MVSSIPRGLCRIAIAMLLLSSGALIGALISLSVHADNTAQSLPFSQNWSSAALISANDNWGGVPGITGYQGDGLTDSTGVDPQTILADGTNTTVDVIANQNAPNTLTAGGVAEFDGIANPTIALQGSGTADAPFIIVNVNTTGLGNIKVSYNLRDIDGSADNAVQPVALQYRTGNSGNFTNLPAGFVADATTGPSEATKITAVNATLPAAANNRPLVQLRIITTNAVGNDEWVGIDDISVTGEAITLTPSLAINDVSAAEGNSGTTTFSFTVTLSFPAPTGGVTFNIATQDNTATAGSGDYVTKSLTNQTIAAGNSSYTFNVTVNGDATPEPNEGFFVNVTNVSGASIADGQGLGTIQDDDTITLIHDIQGIGEPPNFAGEFKMIRGVVVGDFQGATNLNGFFVEEEQSDWDSNTNTSEGIFVFAPGAVNVNVGDVVTVRGKVANFPSTPGLTELTEVTGITVISTGIALPPAQSISLPATAADLEKFEGMRVSSGTLVVTDTSALGQFGELGLSSSKLFTPTNTIDPNDNPATGNTSSGNSNAAAVNAQQSINNNNHIVLDDGKTGSFPNPIPFLAAGNSTIRIGDKLSVTGVLSFGFDSYRIEPTSTPAFTFENNRSRIPDPVGGSLKVASFNIENYFFTLGTRGATTAAERDRQRDKVAAAIAALNADVVGLIELEKGTQANPNAAVNDLLSKLNTLGVGTYAVVPTPAAVYDAVNPVGTDTDIKSGIIYRTSTVAPVGNSLTDTAAAAGTYSRAPIAQTFQSVVNGARFSVVVSHLRSKSCAGSPTGEDGDESTGQGCFNARRRLQSQATVSFINSKLFPVDPDVLLVGDFNAYAQEDPIDVLRSSGLTDLIEKYTAAPLRYSFTFEGQVGQLDHAFATSTFASQATGATIWHINADEPDVFDYNTENKPDDRYSATPYRSADHDPILLGINLACPPSAIEPAVLPDGMKGAAYRQVLALNGGIAPVTFSLSSGSLPDGLSLTSGGLLSGTPLKSGVFNFTVTASSGGGCGARRGYTVSVHEITSTVIESESCVSGGSVVGIVSTVANYGASAQNATFASSLPAQLLALPGSCTANTGSCNVVNGSKVSWTGKLDAGQTARITYRAQIADDADVDSEFCVDSTATIGSSITGGAKACTKVSCIPTGPGSPLPTTAPSSDQKPGSVLIYNVYTSGSDPVKQNTLINITNTEPRRKAYLRLFFIDSNLCGVADYSICLTPSQTTSFTASDFDPGITGYLIVVAVDGNGCPISFNHLIGDEYVRFASGHEANLGAEAVSAIAGGQRACSPDSPLATIAFDGVNYGTLPRMLAVDNIASRAEGNDTMLILNRIGGDLSAESDKLSNIFGIFYDDGENPASFSFANRSCQYIGFISSSYMRTVPRIEQLLPIGHTGWMKIWQTDTGNATTGAAINFSAKASVSPDGFNQGHNLHVLTSTSSARLTIPIIPPRC